MARFKCSVTCFIFFVLTSFSIVLAESHSGIYLSHQCVTTDPSPADKLPVVLLHGLSDIKETWEGIYEVIPFLTQRRVCIYDARNHGDSDWSDSFGIDDLAEDLGNFMTDMGIEKAALVGHSMGGLTIMKFALKNPVRVESLFVEDISPKKIPKDIVEGISASLKSFQSILSALPADADEETANKVLRDYIFNMTNQEVAEHFFKKSLVRCKDGVWQFKSNIQVFRKSLEDADSWIGKFEGRYDGRAFFIYGVNSPFKVNEDEEIIRKLFSKAEFFGVEGADHSVHIHKSIYLNTLVQFLNHKEF